MIRLSLLTLAGLAGAMLIWGEETPTMHTEVIASEVLTNPPVEVVAAEPLVAEIEPKIEVEVTNVETIDLISVKPANKLLVFEAVDAPAGAAIPNAAPVSIVEGAKLLVVTGTSVNMRAGPSTDVDVVGRLTRGAKAVLLAEGADGWFQIRDIASGRVGYMSGDFLTAAN